MGNYEQNNQFQPVNSMNQLQNFIRAEQVGIQNMPESNQFQPFQNPQQVMPYQQGQLRVTGKEVDDSDLSSLSDEIASVENEYRQKELENEAKPIIEREVKANVGKALEQQRDKMKVEVNDMLSNEVGTRIDKYERRRRRKNRKNAFFTLLRFAVILILVGVIFFNNQTRTKLKILAVDLQQLAVDIRDNKETSSNKLINDFLADLHDDLNYDTKVKAPIYKTKSESDEEESQNNVNNTLKNTEQVMKGKTGRHGIIPEDAIIHIK